MILELGKGETEEEKLQNIVLTALQYKIEQLREELSKFEQKYGVKFEKFEKKLASDLIENKYSFEVEWDFLNWEGAVMALEKLRNLSEKIEKAEDN